MTIKNMMMKNSSYIPVQNNNVFKIKLSSVNNGFYKLNIIVRKDSTNILSPFRCICPIPSVRTTLTYKLRQ